MWERKRENIKELFYYFKRSIIKAKAKNTLKKRSYGKKADKLRQKNGQVMAKK